jgi:hypothetical protein
MYKILLFILISTSILSTSAQSTSVMYRNNTKRVIQTDLQQTFVSISADAITNSISWQNRSFFSTASSTNIAVDVGSTSGRKEVVVFADTSFRFYLTNALANTNLATTVYLTVTNSTGSDLYITNVTDTLTAIGNWGTLYAGRNTVVLTYDGFGWEVSQNTALIPSTQVDSLAQLIIDFNALNSYVETLGFNSLDGTATIEQTPYAADGEVSAEKLVRADDSRLNANPNTIIGYDTTTNDTIVEFSDWSVSLGTNEMIRAKAEVFFGGTTNTDRGGFTIVGEGSRTGTGALTIHTGITNISTTGTTSGRDAYFDANGNDFVLKLKGPAGTTTTWGVDGRYRVLTNGVDTVAESGNTLTNSLVAYWKMDEAADGTTPVDRLDSWVNDITLVDAATATDDAIGKIGSAGDFETGQSDTMAVATDVAALDFTSSFSVSVWVRKESSGVLEYVISKWNTSAQRSWNININGSNLAQFAMSTDGGNTLVTTASATTFGTLSINTYYHIVATFDDTADEMTIYVNGTSDTVTQTGTPFNSTQPVRVSGHTTSSTTFDGRIDEIAVWSRAITSDEVLELYNSGSGFAIPLN